MPRASQDESCSAFRQNPSKSSEVRRLNSTVSACGMPTAAAVLSLVLIARTRSLTVVK